MPTGGDNIMPMARPQADEEQIKLASLVENSTDFIGMASPDGQVMFVNPAGRRMVGWVARKTSHAPPLRIISRIRNVGG